MLSLLAGWLASAHAGPVLGVDVGTAVTPHGYHAQRLGVQAAAPSFALRIGHALPDTPFLLPEVSVQTTTFRVRYEYIADPLQPPTDQRLWLVRPTAGLRVQGTGPIRPGLYTHVGVGFAPGYGGSLTIDGGGLLDFAVADSSVGVHGGYEITGLSWANAALVTVGLHVGLPLARPDASDLDRPLDSPSEPTNSLPGP